MGIKLTEIGKSFGDPPTSVLHHITTEILDGEFVSITGRSGSGKSTLLYLMSTLDPPTSGNIEIDGHSIASMSSEQVHQFRNLKMGFVFQFHYLLPELTALENVLMPAMKTRRHKERRPYAEALLAEFGLGNKLNRLPSQLSGGEQQRVAIARSLVMEPRYLFADEPTGNLDSVNGNAVMNLFHKVNAEKNTTVIYVTHDQEFAAMAHRQIQLVDGRMVL